LRADRSSNLRVFKDRTYSTGVFLMTTLGFVLYGSLVLLPIMLQTLLGYPSLQAGIAMAPRGMGSMLGMPVVGFLIGKVDSRLMVAIGLVAGAGTLIWLGQAEPERRLLGQSSGRSSCRGSACRGSSCR
jgi:DHA2 family multidrug resistance protein